MRIQLAAAAGAAAVVAGLAATGLAAPTCPTAATQPACGNRVVPEALLSATFLQYGSELFPALEAIEALAPDVVEVYTLAELTGDDEHVSAGGRDVPIVRVTDEKATGPKKQVAVSLSVHGTEPAGREGGTRFIEDIARWSQSDPDHELRAGDAAFPVSEVLARTETWFGYLNPDGWAAGDLGGTVFARGNENNEDLNREFPTLGWTNEDATPMSEPEIVGWVEFVLSKAPITTSTDIHGELTSANNVFADLMYPAGEWTPTRQAQHEKLGLDTIDAIDRHFAAENVVLGTITGTAGVMKPANAATGYDVVGYDDGGFMGDWFTQKTGAVDIDAENFLSHLAPGNVWFGPLEQAHVAAVRGILEAVVVSALTIESVKPALSLGRVAYVDDPRRVTSADGTQPGGGGEPTKPYDVSRLDYFPDLAADAGVPVTALPSGSIATADLSAYDTIVLADAALPPDTEGRKVSETAYAAALDRFVRAGGQLLLTDAAVGLLEHFGFTDEGDLPTVQTNAGHIDFGDRTHAWEEGITETASQTYYEVPLGFSPLNSAPHYGVATAAWDAAGGTTVGTVGGEGGDFTALGELPLGSGKIAIFGAILPTPTEEETHVEGLAAYGVTIAGGRVLHNILSYRRPGAGPAAPPAPPRSPRPPTDAPLPSTGGDAAAALPLLVLLGGALAVRRIRRHA